MTRHSAKLLAPLALALLLQACGDGGWFGTPSEKILPGTRVSILDREAGLAADPELAGIRPSLPPAFDGAWPQVYGGSDHNAGHRALAAQPSRAWTVDIGEGENGEERRIIYPPVASETAVFTLDAGGEIAAWSADAGQLIWRKNPAPEDEEDGFGGGLAYNDGLLFFAAGFAQVVAFDAGTGDERWRVKLPTPSRAAPTIDAGRLFVMTIDNRLIALDAATGRSLWTYDSPPATAALLGGSAPAAKDGAAIAAMTTGEIVAFRAANGRVTWDDALTAVRRVGVAEAIPAVRALPVIANGQVIAVGAAGFAAGIDFATGARLWDRTIGGAETPAVAGDFMYLVTDQGYLAAMQRTDGKIAWAVKMADSTGDVEAKNANPYIRLYAGPIAAGGHLVVVRGDGNLLFFQPGDGALSHRVELPGRTVLSPIVSNQTMYILTEAGELVAFR